MEKKCLVIALCLLCSTSVYAESVLVKSDNTKVTSGLVYSTTFNQSSALQQFGVETIPVQMKSQPKPIVKSSWSYSEDKEYQSYPGSYIKTWRKK